LFIFFVVNGVREGSKQGDHIFRILLLHLNLWWVFVILSPSQPRWRGGEVLQAKAHLWRRRESCIVCCNLEIITSSRLMSTTSWVWICRSLMSWCAVGDLFYHVCIMLWLNMIPIGDEPKVLFHVALILNVLCMTKWDLLLLWGCWIAFTNVTHGG
jgi:hypothetical protein